jgi:UDP:flavonoid glycosyltransferase YjiC (YdhE family)
MARRRILFVSEAVTLAQIVRLVVLARSLDPARHEIHFASARFDDLVFAGTAFRRWPISSLSAEEVDRAVRAGRRIYDWATLSRYLADDARVLAAVRPDLVVGDLRWSLSIAAPLARVPYAALINAYWSPYAPTPGFPLPDHPIIRLLGEEKAARHFPKALPHVFRYFATPVNELRRDHGLRPLGSLPDVLTHGDFTLFPDVPGLVPTSGAPAGHRYLGPVLWAPALPRPAWWDRLDPGRPTAYVTLGSSGAVEHLWAITDALAELGMQVMVATAGRSAVRTSHRPHVFVADFLPGDQAARRADLVVSNGGSTTGYQALAEGRPVVGVASNLDAQLATQAIVRAGAGLGLRASTVTADGVKRAVCTVLETPSFAASARRVAEEFTRWSAAERFADVVAEAAAA